MQNIINIRHYPEWLERAADYFSSRWNIDRQLYVDSMKGSLYIGYYEKYDWHYMGDFAHQSGVDIGFMKVR